MFVGKGSRKTFREKYDTKYNNMFFSSREHHVFLQHTQMKLQPPYQSLTLLRKYQLLRMFNVSLSFC